MENDKKYVKVDVLKNR